MMSIRFCEKDLGAGRLAAGCGEAVGVRRVEVDKRFERMDRTELNGNVPSERPLLYLRRHDVETKWISKPETILTELDSLVRQEPDSEALFALMELSYIAARRASGDTAAMYSLSCIVYAYSFLFDPAFGPPVDPYNPHSRAACEFYNRSLAAFMIYVRDHQIKATSQRHFPVISGVLDVASWQHVQGLYMLEPYQKNKIPVVFVHGLMSSPETWLAMFNDLCGDPVLRRHYQFWFFMYPTGNQMVVVGHSMGGVISHLMVIDSGDRFWNAFSETPFDQAKLDAEKRELARKVFFFEHLAYVSRVIFIAAPHRGSEWADYRIGRLGSALVGLPVGLIRSTAGLSPKNRIYQLFDEISIRPGLPYHSIMGNTEAGATTGGGDGIVPYSSSHLEGAESEKIVHSGHSAHNHPWRSSRCTASSCCTCSAWG